MAKDNTGKTPLSAMPLPPELVGLPTIVAKPWLMLDPGTEILLEGPAFDRKGNLFVTSPSDGIIFQITPRKKMNIIFNDKNVKVNGSAFHQDGRLFVVCPSGELLIFNPGDNKPTVLWPKYSGRNLSMNDMVFGAKGDIYVTDFTGTIADPTGGVYRVSTDARMVNPVVLHLASPNGISLSPEGNILWVAESSRNTVLRIALLEDGLTIRPIIGVMTAYYSAGCPGPDSNKVDSAGNLYQCIKGQGRVIVLNARGIPIANVVVPGRDEGKSLETTNLAFKPGTSMGYITVSGEGGAWIYTFDGFAKGLSLFSHRRD